MTVAMPVGSSESTIAKHVREQESADIALDRFERQGVRGSVFQITRHGRFDRPATSQGAIGPERSEGQGLESLAGTDRVIPLEQTTRYAGGTDSKPAPAAPFGPDYPIVWGISPGIETA